MTYTDELARLETLDRATIDLIFALRDSLGEVSALDFWQGRAHSAIQTGAAEASTAGHAISRAAQKLQIPVISPKVAPAIKSVTAVIDEDYDAWAEHVDRSLIQIIALASTERAARKTKTAETTTNEEVPF